ncbi:MAG: hypothetical protein JSS76_01125 [Bacteroidetes bacterium]|nr:hypothetical protein [Bacteroidota bacterium]
MSTKRITKILLACAGIVIVLSAALVIHIAVVSRPKADASTVALARIDFKQDINQEDADRITSWLSQQPGVDHVLCNASTETAVFSFYPVKASADRIAADLRDQLHYNGVRYVPDQKALMSGCPVSNHSLSYKIYSTIKHLL